MFRKIIFFVILLIGVKLPAHAAYTGKVVWDVNNNGMSDKTDQPLSGIVVTDGRNTVKTGKDGSFRLPGYVKTRWVYDKLQSLVQIVSLC